MSGYVCETMKIYASYVDGIVCRVESNDDFQNYSGQEFRDGDVEVILIGRWLQAKPNLNQRLRLLLGSYNRRSLEVEAFPCEASGCGDIFCL